MLLASDVSGRSAQAKRSLGLLCLQRFSCLLHIPCCSDVDVITAELALMSHHEQKQLRGFQAFTLKRMRKPQPAVQAVAKGWWSSALGKEMQPAPSTARHPTIMRIFFLHDSVPSARQMAGSTTKKTRPAAELAKKGGAVAGSGSMATNSCFSST